MTPKPQRNGASKNEREDRVAGCLIAVAWVVVAAMVVGAFIVIALGSFLNNFEK